MNSGQRGLATLRRFWKVVAISLGLVAPLPLARVVHAAGPTTYTVTNTSGSASVANSLPWAVQQANYATPGFDVIKFAIPGSGPFTISIGATLYLNEQTVLDGTSQPGYNGSPQIVIVGNSSVPSIILLQGSSSGSTVQGLDMTNYTSNAITIMPSSQGNWIQNNWIGFRKSGGIVLRNTASGLPNATTSRGVGIASSYNVLRNNVISGVDNGVTIGLASLQGAPYKTNSIRGNYIGLDPTGTTATGYGNTGDGIFLGEGASENFLGPDNVSSGNASAGVELFDPSNKGNVIFRNYIGLDASGVNKIGNGELGILFTRGATGNAIGGSFGGNFIAGNKYGGISIGQSTWGAASTNWIQNNTIGLNTRGDVLGGQQVGISINSGSRSNLVEGNIIGGHSEHAVIVGDPSPKNTISNNVRNNYLGRTAGGTAVANGGYGVMFLNAGYNYMTDNMLGTNSLGPVGQQNSPGCVIKL